MKFSRLFLNLERVFRPVPGTGYMPPQELEEAVRLTYEPLARFFTSGSRGDLFTVSFGTGAGGTQTTLLPEPPAGCIRIPILCGVWNPDPAAAQYTTARLVQTTTAQDPWGRWTAGAVPESRIVDRIACPQNTFGLLSVPYVTRGIQIQLEWAGSPAAATCAAVYAFVDVNGELVTIDQLLHVSSKRQSTL